MALAAGLGSTAGCGPSYPPVAGRVTINGEGVAGVQILFIPIASRDNAAPGPYAQGLTDAEGRYSLVTRHGRPGATPGKNVVEFRSSAGNEVAYLRSEAARLQAEARGDRRHAAYEAGAAMLERARVLEGTGGGLTATTVAEFDVPAAGTSTADFDLAALSRSSSGHQRLEGGR